MDIKNRLLLKLCKGFLNRNKKFKDLHKGESCYIFGNGISIKDMDLTKFNDKISICCGYMWLHNQFDALNVKYYSEIEPFWFYPFWKNYYGKIELNPLSALQKRMQKMHPNINFFTSLSNLFGIQGNNVYYLHHFDIKEPSVDDFHMDSVFYFHGSLHVMIGMAIYMGFKSAYLVGCDYTHSPQRVRHFYDKERGLTRIDDTYFADYFNLVRDLIDLTTITSSGSTSKTLKYIEYHNYVGSQPIFRENTELVKSEYLKILSISWPRYVIY